MKVHTHLRFFLLPACTLAVLLLAGCGGGTAPAGPASQLPGGGSATGEYPPVPQLGEGLIEVKMRPQEVVEFGGGGPIARGVSAAFELPSALQSMLPPSKAASFDVFDLRKDGSAYDPALPYNRVMPDSNFAVFSPNWGPAGQNTLSDVAYSTYMFPLQDFGASTQEQTVGVQWDPGNSPDSFFDVFLGFGNIGKDTWDWYMGPDDGVVTVDSFLPYENANGDVLIVLAVLDTKEVRLNSLTVGELEIRGLGDGAPPLFTDVQFIPDFWKIAFGESGTRR